MVKKNEYFQNEQSNRNHDCWTQIQHTDLQPNAILAILCTVKKTAEFIFASDFVLD